MGTMAVCGRCGREIFDQQPHECSFDVCGLCETNLLGVENHVCDPLIVKVKGWFNHLNARIAAIESRHNEEDELLRRNVE